MKRSGVLLAGAILGSILIGCEASREVGGPSEPVKTGITNEFRDAMEKAGNKMMKKQMPKSFSAPPKKAEEAPKKAE